jgi:hypothetical protein
VCPRRDTPQNAVASIPFDADVPAHVQVQEAIVSYSLAHPEDLIGINNAAVAAGGNPLTFMLDQGSRQKAVSAAEYQAAYDSAQSRQSRSSLASSIPTDAFAVSGYWSGVSDSDGFYLSFYGSYNFRNTFDDNGNPLDVFAVQTKSLTTSCYSHEGDDAWVQDETNHNRPERISRKLSDFDSAVFQIQDGTSLGITEVDHGTAYINYKLRNSKCEDSVYGKTYFEHNIDGCNCTWSVSIAAGAMNVSYSRSDPPAKFQKSTSLIKYAY